MARARRVAAVLALALVMSAVPSAAWAERTIGLSSGTFAFTVDAGGTGEGEVVVSNDGDEPLKALVYVSDVVIDAKGEQSFVAPKREGASLMTTPASWFRIYMPADSKAVGNTPYVELDPSEQLPIRFDFSPPVGTAPGDHNVVILFEMFEFSNAEGSSAQVSGRLGARVALRVNGPAVQKMTIRPFEVPAIQIGGKIPFRFAANNEGNLNQRVNVTSSLLDRSEKVVAASVVATDTAVYAQSSKEFRGEVLAPGSAIGPHVVEASVEYVVDEQQLPATMVEQRTIWLVPLWVVVLIGFLVAYSLLFLIYRAVKKRRERRRAAAARRKSHRERELEAEERRRRRDERAAEGAPTEQAASPEMH